MTGGINMDIRAIVCDVDGTLLTSKQIVDKRTVAAIKKARSKGILFGICTGRDAYSVRNHMKSWGIEGCIDFVVGSGGSEIDDYILDIYQENHTLSPELIKEIMIITKIWIVTLQSVMKVFYMHLRMMTILEIWLRLMGLNIKL